MRSAVTVPSPLSEGAQLKRAIRLPGSGRCHRCGGLMVGEFCLDVFNSAGELDVMASRCVLCGDVVDPVIIQNRKRRQETMEAKTSPMSVQSFGGRTAS